MSRKYSKPCEVDKLLVKMRACVVPLTFLGINVKVIEAILLKGVSCKGNEKKSFDTFVEKLSDLVDMIIKELGSKNAEMEKEIKGLDPRVLHQLKRLALLQTATLYYFGPQKLKKGSPGKIEILNSPKKSNPSKQTGGVGSPQGQLVVPTSVPKSMESSIAALQTTQSQMNLSVYAAGEAEKLAKKAVGQVVKVDQYSDENQAAIVQAVQSDMQIAIQSVTKEDLDKLSTLVGKYLDSKTNESKKFKKQLADLKKEMLDLKLKDLNKTLAVSGAGDKILAATQAATVAIQCGIAYAGYYALSVLQQNMEDINAQAKNTTCSWTNPSCYITSTTTQLASGAADTSLEYAQMGVAGLVGWAGITATVKFAKALPQIGSKKATMKTEMKTLEKLYNDVVTENINLLENQFESVFQTLVTDFNLRRVLLTTIQGETVEDKLTTAINFQLSGYKQFIRSSGLYYKEEQRKAIKDSLENLQALSTKRNEISILNAALTTASTEGASAGQFAVNFASAAKQKVTGAAGVVASGARAGAGLVSRTALNVMVPGAGSVISSVASQPAPQQLPPPSAALLEGLPLPSPPTAGQGKKTRKNRKVKTKKANKQKRRNVVSKLNKRK